MNRSPRPFVLACGALVRELRAVLEQDGLTDAVELAFLPAPLHNRPERIVPAIEARLADVDPSRPIFLGYADCGTGGLLDAWIERTDRDVTRLPGSHCYEFFAGAERFAELHEEEFGTFYLTDFLARHFDSLVWEGFGIEQHPELRDMYFGNYRRVVLLSQSDDPVIVEFAKAAAAKLQLEFVHEHTGLAPFAHPVRLGLTGAVA
ncbi:MAG: DUF1638 domain-containing protein [Ilumatobacteraceae bacterium]